MEWGKLAGSKHNDIFGWLSDKLDAIWPPDQADAAATGAKEYDRLTARFKGWFHEVRKKEARSNMFQDMRRRLQASGREDEYWDAMKSRNKHLDLPEGHDPAGDPPKAACPGASAKPTMQGQHVLH